MKKNTSEIEVSMGEEEEAMKGDEQLIREWKWRTDLLEEKREGLNLEAKFESDGGQVGIRELVEMN